MSHINLSIERATSLKAGFQLNELIEWVDVGGHRTCARELK